MQKSFGALRNLTMAEQISISVVIPCYNACRYIGAAIRSVMLQDWPDLELIVVDDGSTDGSADLVARQFPWVNLLRVSNGGVAAARNIGIAHARGEWIAFLDADDIWLPEKLSHQWQLLGTNTGARMCYTAWQTWASAEPEPGPEVREPLEEIASDSERWAGPSGWIYPDLLLDCVVWTSTVLAHRSVFDATGVFDAQLRIGEDWDLWLRASRVTPILRVPKPLALYRMHPTSITKAVPDTNYKSLVVSRAIDRWGYGGPDGRAARPSDVHRSQARTWSDIAGACLLAGQTQRALEAAMASVRTFPRQTPGWRVLAKAWARSVVSRSA